MNRHQFLQELHRLTLPRSYLEIGMNKGLSLGISRVPSIGIDPSFSLVSEVLADVHIARTTSDEFFARRDPTAHLPIRTVDLAFIDGMHLAEYALRDYLAVERFTEPTSVIVLDDMLPRNVEEASRERHTEAWTGDVYKAGRLLRDQCPELVVLEVDTEPTGVVVVLAPNAARRGVLAAYDDWLEVAVAPDPQDVPSEILLRTRALDPVRLLASPGWTQLPRLRRRSRHARDRVREAFADVIGDVRHPSGET